MKVKCHSCTAYTLIGKGWILQTVHLLHYIIKTIMKQDRSGRRIGKRAYPLRKILQRNVPGEYFGTFYERLHLLECGHSIPPVSDIYGETATISMRCRLCYEMK